MLRIAKRVASAAAVASFFFAAGAQAGTSIGQGDSFDFGALSGTSTVTVPDIQGAFHNTFYFSLSQPTTVTALLTGWDIVGGMTASAQVGYGPDAAHITWLPGVSFLNTDILSQEDENGFFAMAGSKLLPLAGTYAFDINGSATLAQYSLTLAAPVPEPDSLALMALGAVVTLALARRRQAN